MNTPLRVTSFVSLLSNVLAVFLFIWPSGTEAQESSLSKADSLYAMGAYAQAINEYARKPDHRSQWQIARAYDAMGLNRKAVAQYQHLLINYPDLDVARFEAAKLLYRLKQFVPASAQLDTLLEKHPDQAEFLYYRGMAALKQQQEKAGIAMLRSVIQKDSIHLRSLFQLSKYYLKKNQPDSVLFFSELGLRQIPDDVSLINLKAQALYNRDSFREAIPEFRKLIAFGEEKPHIWEKLGNSHLVLYQNDSARAAYRRLLKFEGLEATAFLGLGRTFHGEQMLDSARFYYLRAIDSKKPVLAQEYKALGRIEQEEGHFSKALDYYRLMMAEIGDDLRIEYQICTLTDKTESDPTRAIECYEGLLDKYENYSNFFTQAAAKRLKLLKQNTVKQD